MTRMVPALAMAATVVLAGSQISFAQTAPADIKARQDAMEKMWSDYFKDIATTIRSGNPDLPLIATKAAGAIEHQKKIAQLFPPGPAAMSCRRPAPSLKFGRSARTSKPL